MKGYNDKMAREKKARVGQMKQSCRKKEGGWIENDESKMKVAERGGPTPSPKHY